MSFNARECIRWLLPFVVSGGMAFGALVGFSSASEALRQEGPSGDMAGAAGAVVVMICLLAGFVVATLTVIVAKLVGRDVPDHVPLRVGLSIAGGGFVGAAGWNSGPVMTAMVWLVLFGVPAVLSWSRRTRAVPDPDASPQM